MYSETAPIACLNSELELGSLNSELTVLKTPLVAEALLQYFNAPKANALITTYAPMCLCEE